MNHSCVPIRRSYRRRRVISLGASAAIVIAIGVTVGVAVDRHAKHKFSYAGRDWVGGEVVSAAYVNTSYHQLFATRDRVNGLPVYLNRHRQNRREDDATILFLRRGDGSFRIYDVQGGP